MKVGKLLKVENLKFKIYFSSDVYKNSKLSFWHFLLLKNGCTTEFRNSLVINLNETLSDIKRKFRKSYKPLINKGLRTWNCKIYDSSNYHELNWKEFKQLHFKVAKRKTRSDKSWIIQNEMIKTSSGTLVCLNDPSSNLLIGAGFFQFTRDESIYSTAAYDRSLFKEPLGHLVQWLAICYFKDKKIKHYRLGESTMPEHTPESSEKEQTISFFKEGFTDGIFPEYVLTYSYE